MAYLGYFNSVIDPAGNAVAGATVSVYLTGTATLATIYSTAAGAALANPFTADSLGRFQFFAAAGVYDIEFSGSGVTTFKIEAQIIGVAAADLPTGIDAVKIADGSVSSAEFQYLNGVTSGIQGQIGGKVNTGMVLDARDYASFAAAISTIGATEGTLVVSTSLAVAADVTVPATLSLRFERGGELAVATTKTVTINGHVESGSFKIFALTGTGAVVFGEQSIQALYPEWWGAAGDGSTDDAVPLAACFVSYGANPNRRQIILGAKDGYATTAALTVGVGISLIQNGKILYTGSSDVAALTVGVAGTVNGADLRLWVQRETQSNWTSESNIGIKLLPIAHSKIEIVNAMGFTIGVQLLADSAAIAYNSFDIAGFWNNKVGLDLVAPAAGNGYVNENNFRRGLFSVSAAVNPTLDRWGVRINGLHASFFPNNNTFNSPCFELSAAAASGVARPILLVNAVDNGFYNCRHEDNDSPVMEVTGVESYGNVCELGYGLVTARSDAGDNPTSRTFSRETGYREHAKLVFHSGRIPDKAASWATGGSDRVHVAGLHYTHPSYADVFKYSISDDAIALTTDCAEVVLGGFGVMVDTNATKSFVIYRNVSATAYGGRIAIRCYDSAGAVLDGSGATVYVKAAGTYWSTDHGGIYTTSSDSDAPLYIRCHADVKKIAVLFMAGSANLRIRSFSIYCPGGMDGDQSCAWAGYEEIVPGGNIGLAAPTKDLWSVGKIVWSDAPASGSPLGWQCISRVDTTLNGGEPGGETSMVVASGTGVADNDVIGVVLDTGAVHWTTVASGGGTTTLVLAAALPSAAATGKAVYTMRWKAMPNL